MNNVNNVRIITISREFGSGGRTIGKLLAERLGISFYDKELIALVAKQSGFSVDFVEEVDEEVTGSFLFNLATSGLYNNSGYSRSDLPIQDNVFLIQNKVINNLANTEPCVIVGRAADYILKNREDCLHVFIHSDMADKKERISNTYKLNISEKNLEKEINKKDKARANHYRRYTSRIWGLARNYNITLDTGKFGLENCVGILENIVNKKNADTN